MRMRLQKILAQSGLASRREAEAWIQAGRVSVNGKIVTALGSQADPDVDRILVDGKPIGSFEPKVYYLLNKPAGYVSTCADEHGRPTVLDLLKAVRARLFPVGRLDWDTEGVLLLTNDGELAQRLMHPRYQITRTYLARVEGIPTQEALQRLAELSVAPHDPTSAPSHPPRGHKRQEKPRAAVQGADPLPPGTGEGRERGRRVGPRRGDSPRHVSLARVGPRHAWVEISLREGQNRQVRRMCEEVGHPVKRLRRIRFAGLTLEGSEPGQYRALTPAEIQSLRRLTRLERPSDSVPRPRRSRPSSAG
jgi:23S rRNA pseudouridine2605 synthase